MKNILKTILEIHNHHIIHRDLKPENILMTDSEDLTSIIIADFGLATFDKTIEKEFVLPKCGTPGFLAPEVIKYKNGNKYYDQKVDIFSLGVVFFIL